MTGIDERDRVTFNASGQAMVSEQVDTNRLQEQLAGRTLEDASAWLNQNVRLMTGTVPLYTLEPEWLPQLPVLPMRIQVQVVNNQ